MTEHTTCAYEGDRADALLAYLYGGVEGRAAFDRHLASCAVCRDELDALEGIRARLVHWAPPEPVGTLTRQGEPAGVVRGPWRALAAVPAWAQVAAASLIVGVSVGIANVHVEYGDGALTIHSGWWPDRAVAAAPSAVPPEAPWRDELAALRAELEQEVAATRTAVIAEAQSSPAPRNVQAGQETEQAQQALMRQVRSLIDESERKHQRELALRVGEAMRDVSAQRRADLVNIDRSLGTLQNTLGVEMLKQREQLNNYVLRVSSQK
jgi:hypothetical protein